MCAPAAEQRADRQPEVVGRQQVGLSRITAWLDYAADLGFTGLLLGPIFASSTHGYDTLDYRAIDPRLGDLDDFLALAAACREREIALVLDGVFNHVGADHKWVRDALAAGPDGEANAMVTVDWSTGTAQLGNFEGHDQLVTLNHESERVVDEVADIMRLWIDRGASGWRLDAAYAVPAEFWRRSIGAVHTTHPDAWFLGEVIHGNYPGFVESSGVDTVTQYELWKSIWSALSEHNLFELDWTLTRHGEFCEVFTPATFVGNHDVTRIASTLGVDGAIAALWILMTLPGTPFVYYGDEVGAVGVKEERAGGDDAVRPEYPAAPPSGWASDADAARVQAAHREAIALRRSHPWLVRAHVEVEQLENERITYVARGTLEGEALRVDVDLTAAPHVTITAVDPA
ncbi:MAG: alpha-amylase [Actinobacteria bacterium HGW-Actinobacteria-8]|nr:MAG: alpha-amylase [Actinobacteria bacterium HGW-Actinobacteria-8]